MARAMPPAVAVSPPVSTPSQPCSSTALRTPWAREDDPGHHVAHQNAGGGEAGLVQQHLADGTENAAQQKGVEVFHH